MIRIINRLFVGQVKDLNSFKKHIAKVLYTLSIGSILFAAIIFCIIYTLFVTKERSTVVELINNANSILQSNLSEQISIIANNQDFISYLRSGVISRQQNYPEIAGLFSNLDSNLIPAVSIVDQYGNSVFASGNPTNFSTTVNLCYMGDRINTVYGMCNYQMTLYFNQKAYLVRLNKINPSIGPCTNKECKIYNLFSNGKMGSFPVITTNSPEVAVNFDEAHSYELLILIVVFICLILILTLVSLKIVRRIVDNHLANPISEIQESIKIGKRPKANEREYLTELSYLLKILNNYQDEQLNIELGKRVAQVAHDIRSPLTAIETLTGRIDYIPEAERIMFRNAAIRINDIALSLLREYKGQPTQEGNDNLIILYLAVIEIASEKRMEHSNKNTDLEIMIDDIQAYFSIAKGNISEFKRLLSNLINNSVNAMPNGGKVEIILSTEFGFSVIKIVDSGCGISDKKLAILFSDELKPNESGVGLGLSHARKYLKTINGSINISSKIGKGTEVTIKLPYCRKPDWLCNEIKIEEGTVIAVVDDDPSIHDVWRQKIRHEVEEKLDISLHQEHFNSPKEFLEWITQNSDKNILLLADYEYLNEPKPMNGLEMFKILGNYGIQKILVTSYYEKPKIINELNNGITLLPKQLVNSIELEFNPKAKDPIQYDLVFIDDTDYNIKTWEKFADLKKVRVKTYRSTEEFWLERENFSFTTPIYVDQDFGVDKESGVDFTKRLYDAGYKNLYLATSYIIESDEYYWLKGITSKKPPFI